MSGTERIITRARPQNRLKAAIHRHRAASGDGFLERLFTFAFKGLVYPQIWEDPEIDLEALQIRPSDHVVTIASGGCNVLSYLTADPARVTAVDLNRAHVALTRLKLHAARSLPTYETFYRFFGEADAPANVAIYDRFLKAGLDPEARAYWERRTLTGRRRVTLFARDLYRHGLLGKFIGLAHAVARLHGIDPKTILQARSLDEQRSVFEASYAPLFDRRLVRWATGRRIALFGLGIPPQQYEALASAGAGDMALVLRNRLERLACGFPVSENYFAWQAFARGYAPDASGPLPPYLRREHFRTIAGRVDRVSVLNTAYTEFLAGQPAASVDRYILLDAQDWMTDRQLDALWAEITRTAAPGARVVFRTAAEPSLLPGRVHADILARWIYEEETSRSLIARDRASIYGGVHLYRLDG